MALENENWNWAWLMGADRIEIEPQSLGTAVFLYSGANTLGRVKTHPCFNPYGSTARTILKPAGLD